MNIWVDDIREPPQEQHWVWAKTSEEALHLLRTAKDAGDKVTIMSLDHDLGGEDTSRPVVMWMCESGFWPQRINVHSANPVGRDWLLGTIERYKS